MNNPAIDGIVLYPCPFCGKAPSVTVPTSRVYCSDHTLRLNVDDWNDQVATASGDLPPMVWNELREWLMSREGDIAHGMEDFGELRGVFRVVVDRDAEKD